MSTLTETGTLLVGVEHGGKYHKDFTMRVATVEDVENAIEDAGPDACLARVNRHKWSCTITRIGDIPPDEITVELLAGLTAEEYGIIKNVEAALLKKLVASSAETSAASEK